MPPVVRLQHTQTYMYICVFICMYIYIYIDIYNSYILLRTWIVAMAYSPHDATMPPVMRLYPEASGLVFGSGRLAALAWSPARFGHEARKWKSGIRGGRR